MGKTSASINIPVSIQAQIDNIKELRDQLTNAMNSAGKDSNLVKTLTKDLSKLEPIIRNIENITLQPTIDDQGIRTLERLFGNFFTQINKSFAQIDMSSFEQIASTQEIEHLKALAEEAEKYRKEIEAIEKTGSKRRTDDYLTETKNTHFLDMGKKYKAFDITAPLSKNALTMERASESYRKQAEAVKKEMQELDQKSTEILTKAQNAKNTITGLESKLSTVSADNMAAKFHHAMGRFTTGISANRQTKNPTISSIESGLRASLESVQDKGKIASSAQAAVSDWLKDVFNISTSEAQNLVQTDINTLLKNIMTKIFGTGYSGDTDLVYNADHAGMLSEGQRYSASEIQRLAQKYQLNQTNVDLSAQERAVKAELKKRQDEYKAYNDTLDKMTTTYLEKDDIATDLSAAAYETQALSKNLYTLADAAKEADIALKEGLIRDNETQQDDYKQGVVDRTKKPLEDIPDAIRNNQYEVHSAIGGLKGAQGRAQLGEDETKRFVENLKTSIKHWMSAQQIITMVRAGIRQALADIKGLDTAMTNIAVVTDMSVSELWGKIDEYMSIAQQYGVTTQGVYEVSQLYYQQGLSASEVMSATTETLKMARIAGMDYAEAADAMTVAIRAFKMEMSDAQHVTDVYSKVAAVTASDTNELATAMSKTASSAESVGSSFENTTAMLAVMIETTRESAQNLGSALKSIISRYGEMKVGLTVDSEGEEIDYNKVDTALKSVGISIKDAQGQFRDFDDVIFELSEKWDTLDKNTQRYIATIMAGNRQQSRFIALVDNWERLEEVTKAAQDSEGAGLLQYSKTLESLDAKLNNIKASFQELYMSIANGPVFKSVLDFINNILQGFTKMKGSLLGTIPALIASTRLLFTAIGALAEKHLAGIHAKTMSAANRVHAQVIQIHQKTENSKTEITEVAVQQRANTEIKGAQQVDAAKTSKKGFTKEGIKSFFSNNKDLVASVVTMAGSALSIMGASQVSKGGSGNQQLGAVMTGLGNTVSGAATGYMLGNLPGAIIGGILGALTSIKDVFNAFSELGAATADLEQANKELEEANIEKAKAQEEETNLQTSLDNLKRLQKARFSSAEAEQEYQNALESFADTYPNLITQITASSEAIVDLEAAEFELAMMRKKTLDATIQAALAESKAVRAERKVTDSKIEEARKQLFSSSETGYSAASLGYRYALIGAGKDPENIVRTFDDGMQGYKNKEVIVSGDEQAANKAFIDFITSVGLQAAWEPFIDFTKNEMKEMSYADLSGESLAQLLNAENLTRQAMAANKDNELLKKLVQYSDLGNFVATQDEWTINLGKINQRPMSAWERYSGHTQEEVAKNNFGVLIAKVPNINFSSQDEYDAFWQSISSTFKDKDQAIKDLAYSSNTGKAKSIENFIRQNYTPEHPLWQTYMELPPSDSIKVNPQQYSTNKIDEIEEYNKLLLERRQQEKKINIADKVTAQAYTQEAQEIYGLGRDINSVYEQDWIKNLAIKSVSRNIYDENNGFFEDGKIASKYYDGEEFKEADFSADVNKAYSDYIGRYQEGLKEFFKDQAGKIEDFSEIEAQLYSGALEDQDVKTLLGVTDLNEDKQSNEFIKSVLGQYNDARAAAMENFINWMSSDDLSQKAKDFGILDKDGKVTQDWQKYLSEIPFMYWTAIGNIVEDINDQVEKGLDAAQDKEIINKQAQLYSELPSKYQHLLANADLSSEMGQLAFAQELRKAGATPDELKKWLGVEMTGDLITGFGEDAIPTYTNNLVTSYQTVIDKISSGLEGMRSTLDKASQEMDVEDALDIAKTFGIDFNKDNFGFNEETGKWFLKNQEAIEQYINNQYKEELDLLAKQQEDFKGIETQDALAGSKWQSGFDSWRESTKGAEQGDFSGTTYDFDTAKATYLTYLEDLIAQKKQLQENTEWLSKYYVEQSNLLELIQQYQDMPISGASDVSSEAAKIYSLMKDKGSQKYTKQEISELDNLLPELNLQDYVTHGVDDTYSISPEGMKEILKVVPEFISSLIKYSIDNLTEATLEDFSSFGKQMAQGESIDFTGYFDAAISEMGYLTEAIIKQHTKNALAGNILSRNRLKELIQSSKNVDSTTAEKMVDEYLKGYASGLTENVEEFEELYIKKLLGKANKKDNERYKELLAQVDSTHQAWDSILSQGFSERLNKYNELLWQQVESGDITQSEIPSMMVSALESMIDTTTAAYNAELQSIQQEVSEVIATTGGKGLTTTQLAQLQYVSGLQGADLYESDGKGGYNISNNALIFLKSMYADAFAQYEETAIRNRIKATEDFLQTALSDTTKVETSQVKELYASLGKDITWQEAQKIAQTIVSGGTEAAIAETKKATEGLNIPGIEEKIQRLAQLIFDSIIEGISSGLNDLSSGMKGELSAESYAKLVDKYGLSGRALKTSTGLAISKADQKQMLIGMYKDAEKSGATMGFGQQAWATLLEAGVDYADIQEELAAVKETIKNVDKNSSEEWKKSIKSAEDYLKVLEQINNASKLDPNNPMFDFMNQDPTDGLTQNFDTFVGSIEQVQGIFESFKAGEAIGYRDFYNMMDFINNQGQWDTLATNLGKTGAKYEDFVNTIVSNTDKWGKVDIAGVAAEMDISVDAAMSAMQDSMSDSLAQVAKDQIKYLSGLEKMLEAMLVLEEMGNIELSIDLQFKLNGEKVYDLQDLRDVDELYAAYMNLAPQDRGKFLFENRDLITQLQESAKTTIGKMEGFLKTLGFDNPFTVLFGTDLDFTNGLEMNLFAAMADLARAIPNLTQEQAMAVAEGFYGSLDQTWLTYDAEGKVHFNPAYLSQIQQAFIDYIQTQDWSNIPKSINSEVNAAMAKEGDTEITATGVTIALTDSGFVIKDFNEETFEGLDTAQITELKKKIADEYKIEVGDIQVDAEGRVTFTPLGAQEDQEAIKQVNTQFKEASEAAETLNKAITGINNGISSFTYSGAFKEFLEAIINAAAAADKLKGFTSTGLETTTSDGSGGQLPPIHYAPPTVQTSVSQAIAYGDNGPILAEETELPPVKVTADTTEVEQKIDETKQKIEEENPKIRMGANTEEAEREKNELLDTIDNSSATAKINADPTLAQQALQGFLNTPAIKHIKLVASPLLMKWTGTMNDISGSAFADGSIGRLHSGAQLANKVLVGELGPELAVYDGQYHMLGANGAEFVNLPKDAIIFNHIQTAGILDGQFNIRGTAMAEGNVSGPAFAGGGGGIAAALAAVRRAKSVWQGLLDNLIAADLFGGGGGGGGGDNSIKAVTQELQEWYNLSRQIANTEQEINNLIAERANIQKKNGAEYLRNLREQEKLLYEQIATQDTLLQYQELQLQRQADHINQNQFWSKFLTVGEDGLLQYIVGNEADGGKGELTVLQQMNEMSGAQQLSYLQSIGYTYTDQDGKQLEGEELITKFFEELQQQIDEYDTLYNTVHETLGALEELETQINEINEEVKQNQIELEQNIYDIIVSAWEKEIEEMQKQTELIKEANDEYINGLNKAIEEERKLYDEQKSVSDREALQRQLSLLRRSGGSAQEIYDLEQQLNDMLKDEYFNKQEKMIENIQDASEEQVRKLEEQIKLQEDALEYQKENGIIWTKVYEVLSGSEETITAFMQGNSPEFFEQSNLQQEEMLTDWAHKIGLYTEDRQRENHEADAAKMWSDGNVWKNSDLTAYQDVFNAQSAEAQGNLQTLFNKTYANALLDGKTTKEALQIANAELLAKLKALKDAANAQQDIPNTDNQNQTTGTQGTQQQQTKKEYWGFEYNGKLLKWEGELNARNAYNKKLAEEQDKIRKNNSIWQSWVAQRKAAGQDTGPKSWEAYVKSQALSKFGTVRKISSYATGGLVDYTGLAMVHGSSSKPEAFLNAEQTAQIREALAASSKGGVLNSILNTLQNLQHSISSITHFVTDSSKTITISPNAINISVGQLANSYDVDDLSNDIMNRIASIAAKASGRGVNRR